MKFDGHTDTYGGNLTARSETLDARGNVMRSSTYTDAAMPSSWQVLERPDSIHPALSYSVAGGPVLTVTATAVTNSFAYDGFARRTVVTDGRGNATLTHYNALGQEEYTENAAGNRTTYGYDALGRRTVRIDALGNAVTNAYDTLGRRVAASGATYPVTHGYDTEGRMMGLATTRDGRTWDSTAWLYDAASGLATNKVYADESNVAYTHTPDGKPLRTTWARGEWREHAYNADGLLAATDYSDATPAVALAYDAFQRFAYASNSVAQYSYANSALGVATSEVATVNGNTVTLTRGLDDRQRLAAISFNGQLHATYSYGAENRFAVVSNDAFTVAYAYTSDGWDAGYTVTLINGMVLSRNLTRDPHRRSLIKAITNAIDGVPLNPLVYGYDLLDRVTARNADTFGYNAHSEVTSALIQPAHTNRYEYDGIGNALWASLNTATNVYLTNPLNQYTNIANGSTVEPLYDPDGNMTWDGRFTYAWDAEHRLIAAYSNNLCIVSNAYDHMSRRVTKVTPCATHSFLYDGWNLIQETISTASGTATNHYVWGKDLSGAMQGAGGVGGLLAVSIDCTWYYPLFDNNGNITDYVDASGNVVAHREYGPFGETLAATDPVAHVFNFWFSTKYLDHETGLYYYGYRYYNPELGRWLSRDSIDEDGGLNLYGFVGNDSVNYADALGEDFIAVGSRDVQGVKLMGFNHMSIYLFKEDPPCTKKGAKFVFDKIPSSATAEGFFELLAKGNLYGRKWKSGKKQDEEKVTVSVIYNKVTSASADARNFVVIYSDADLPNPAFKLASQLWSKKIVPAATSYKYALQSGSLPSKLDSSNWPRVMYVKKLGATNSNTFIATLARLLWADANAVKGFHIGADTPSTPEDQHLKTRGYPVRVTP